MPSDGRTFTETHGRWKVLATNLLSQLETLPHLAPRHLEITRILTEAETLEVRQSLLKADLQEVNRKRREILKTGEDLRNRIGAILRAEHGFTSERLVEFGLKPKRIIRRTRKQDAPTKPPEQSQSSPSSAK